MTLTQKLYPGRFPGMSGKMAAIVAYVLGEDWTSPRITEMAVTSDGGVLAAEDGEVGLNHFIGDGGDLDRNVRNLLDVAGLTDEERAEWGRLYQARVEDWRRSGT